LKILDKAPGVVVLGCVAALIPFVLAGASFLFLSEGYSRSGPQNQHPLTMGVLMSLYPAIVVSLLFLVAMVDKNLPGLLLSAIWTWTLLSYVFLFPVVGGALLIGQLRGAQRGFA
jgi:hypothetical protein